jgi:hypothetical protein
LPQRQFWTEQHELRLTASFALDPTTPGAPPWFAISVYDQEGALVEQGTYRLPPKDAEAAAIDVFGAALRSWFASDAEAALVAARREVGDWWAAAEAMNASG